MTGGRQGIHGFTLVEMLVAVFVFGLLSAAGVGVLASAADSRAAVAERMQRLAEFQRARAMLHADLSQAALRRVRQVDGSAARDAFHGATASAIGADGNSMLFGFVRRGWSNPDQQPRPSLQYVEYRLAGGTLERSTRPMLDGTAPGAPVALLHGIRATDVRYRYRGQWSDGWPGGTTALPEAVVLEFDLDGFGPVEQWFLLPAEAP